MTALNLFKGANGSTHADPSEAIDMHIIYSTFSHTKWFIDIKEVSEFE